MEQQHDAINQKSVELIKELMEQELTVAEQHRMQASLADEPKLKSLIVKLTETHEQSYAELRMLLGEVNSQNEITQQINEMFL